MPTKKKKSSKVVVVMPAYNAEKTIKKTFNDIPKEYRKHVILVDDGSSDKTIETAKKLGITVFDHPRNLGYGGNQKTCYWEALKLNPDVVVMLHPDYQYDATLTGELVRPILEGRYDAMFGSRIRTRKEALEGGMPAHKYFFNRLITPVENMVLGVNFSEHMSGFRAYSKKVLKKVPFGRMSNDFILDQEMMASVISFGFKVGETPVPVRYYSDSSSIGWIKGFKFGVQTWIVLFKFTLNSLGIYKHKIFH
jgi:glycosyltransferase involved in cell wall biosynthesis